MLAGLLLFLVGIPVTDPTVIAKCGTCHASDDRGNMQGLSFARSTPEGWQAVLKRMLRTSQITITPPEARDIVKYLSDTHGLSPEESKPFLYEPERRVHDETAIGKRNAAEDLRQMPHAGARAFLAQVSGRLERIHRCSRNALQIQIHRRSFDPARPVRTPR